MPGNLPILMPKHPPETVITDTNIWISSYRIIVINFEELCQLGISYPQRISLKSVDYQFLLYCVKFKPDKIETYDKQLSKHIQASQNNEKTE